MDTVWFIQGSKIMQEMYIVLGPQCTKYLERMSKVSFEAF